MTNENVGVGTSVEELTDLMMRMQDIKKYSKDYVSESSDLRMVTDADGVSRIVIKGVGAFKPTNYGMSQIHTKCGIPDLYGTHVLKTNPGLHAEMVNNDIGRNKDRKMIRTIQFPDQDPIARAMVSDKFFTFDSADVYSFALPLLKDYGAKILSANLSETNFYLKALTPKVYRVGTPQVGEVVQRGICIRNSDVGAGAFTVQPYVFVLACSNGMIRESVMRRVHLGRKQEMGEVFTNRTRELEAETLFSQMRDIINATFDERTFTEWQAQMNLAQATKLKKPVEAVQATLAEYKLPQDLQKELLNQLAGGLGAENRGATVWGLANAVTAVAKAQDLDRRYELEMVGADILSNKRLMAVIA